MGFLKVGDLGPLQKVLLWDGVHPRYIGLATWAVILSETAVGTLLICVSRPQVIGIALGLFAVYTVQLMLLVRHPTTAPSCACMTALASKIRSDHEGNVLGLWRNVLIVATGALAVIDLRSIRNLSEQQASAREPARRDETGTI